MKRFILTAFACFFFSSLSAKALVDPYLYDLRDDGVMLRAVGNGKQDVFKVKIEGGKEYLCAEPKQLYNGKFLYAIDISDLTPVRKYTYSMSFGKKDYGAMSFTTAPKRGEATEFKLAVWGDTQTVVMNMKAAESLSVLNPDILLHVGDLVRGDGRNWNEWVDYFFSPAQQLFRKAAVFPVPGNHEQGVALFTDLFPIPKTNSSKHAGNGYYTYDFGNAHFVAIHMWKNPDIKNSDETLYDANLNGRDDVAELLGMLKEDAARPETIAQKWKIVYMHMPPDFPKASEGSVKAWKTVLPYLKEYKPDIVFFGHKHIFSDTRDIIVDGENSGIKGMTVGLYWSRSEDFSLENAPSGESVIPSFAGVVLNRGGKPEMSIQPYLWNKEKKEFLPSVKETIITK